MARTKDTIFVQIASYRDPELLPTLDDLFDKASKPDNLKVCIAWQHNKEDKWDNLDKYKNDDRVIIDDIDYKESLGVCWARNRVQQHYNGEKYTLQLDSHHRFAKGWDKTLIHMLVGLQKDGFEKPLLTGYIPSYNPTNDPAERVHTPWKMDFHKFIPEGAVFFLPAYMDNFKELTGPIRARFYSAHFAFTVGEFANEVQHDPSFYFHGEEITIAVRAYTHGYDLFHPHKVVAWHEYTREGRVKQWDDDPTWTKKNEVTHAKVRSLLGIDGTPCTPCNQKSFGKYYLGNKRTLRDYEEYAGLHFETRGVSQHTLDRHDPPNPKTENFIEQFNLEVPWEVNFKLSEVEGDVEKWDFIACIFKDQNGNDLHRQDVERLNLPAIIHYQGDMITLKGSYKGRPYTSYVVWPCKDGKWMENPIQRAMPTKVI